MTIELGPLSVGALHELPRARVGAVLPRPMLLRIWETSGGNPFFALELAASLPNTGAHKRQLIKLTRLATVLRLP